MIKIVLSADVTDDVFNFTMAFVVTFNGSVFTCFICEPIVITGSAAVKSIFGKQQVLKICLAR